MKKKFKILFALVMVVVMALTLTACNKEDDESSDDTDNNVFVNPGDYLGGGKEGTMPTLLDISENITAIVTAGDVDYELDESVNMDINNATALDSSALITESGEYILTGDYTNGIIDSAIAKKSVVHLFLNGANISSTTGSAIIKTDNKITLIITLVDGTTNTISNSVEGANTLAVKGDLIVNGTGSLTVTATGEDSTAIKVSKSATFLGGVVTVSSTKHGIAAEEIEGHDCTINILSAEKDGLHAECDYDNEDNDTSYTYTTDSGYITLTNVNYTCSVYGDGIQADTFVYIEGGTYNITTTALFVTKANQTTYDLEDEDYKYNKSGKSYYRVDKGSGSYALAQSAKGIKVGEIEYDSNGDDTDDQSITEGNYTIYIASGTFNIDSADDAIHTNCGNAVVAGGTFTIETYDDGITADNFTKVSGGDITISTCYEGIEGHYVEISGGTINIVALDDGINAAGENERVTDCYIYITGGTTTVDATGDGTDSNGSTLVTGGTLTVYGPTNGGNAGLDSETGIIIKGGTVFASSAIGMVETPATNSTQYVLSFAQQTSIPAGTVITIKDSSGNTVFTTTVTKACQSIIVSTPDFQNGASYTVYGGETSLATFTISSIITSVGSSTQMGGMGDQGGMGGMIPGGQGGMGGQGGQGGFDPNGQGGGVEPPTGNGTTPPDKPE